MNLIQCEFELLTDIKKISAPGNTIWSPATFYVWVRMITRNVLQRIFQIKHRNSLSTCFTMDIDNRQYIVTAKHCIGDFDSAQFQIYKNGQWKNIDVSLVGFGTCNADIAVLSAKEQLSPTDTLASALGPLAMGQDLFFLGFPLGFRQEVGDINLGFPLPFVKKAILSALSDPHSDLNILFLDGHNNGGFSGGPVIFAPVGKPATDFRIGAVVSAYCVEKENILFNELPTELHNQGNSGIIISHSIEHAIETIKANPTGFNLVTSEST